MQRASNSLIPIKRSRRASMLAELPMILWAVLMVIAFPLLDLTTVFLRISFLYGGIHFASISAGRANSFSRPIDGKPSAQAEALSKLSQIEKGFSGLSIKNINTAILVTHNDTLAVTSQFVPLAVPADQSVNSYQIEVSADCSADPLIPIPIPFKIEGLNAPITVHLSAKQYCENPQGLTI
ncbi:hypothetical protein BH11CYA1_BH11CYA1_04900 [soil metagenome]